MKGAFFSGSAANHGAHLPLGAGSPTTAMKCTKCRKYRSALITQSNHAVIIKIHAPLQTQAAPSTSKHRHNVFATKIIFFLKRANGQPAVLSLRKDRCVNGTSGCFNNSPCSEGEQDNRSTRADLWRSAQPSTTTTASDRIR